MILYEGLDDVDHARGFVYIGYFGLFMVVLYVGLEPQRMPENAQ